MVNDVCMYMYMVEFHEVKNTIFALIDTMMWGGYLTALTIPTDVDLRLT